MITYSIIKGFPPFFKGNDDEVSVQSKNTKGQEALEKKRKRENDWIATLNLLLKGTHWYLSIVGDSTEELQFKVKSSRIFVEQPPQAAGQVLQTDRETFTASAHWHFSLLVWSELFCSHRYQANREQQGEQNMSDCLSVIRRWRSRRWQVQWLLRGGGLLVLLAIKHCPTQA